MNLADEQIQKQQKYVYMSQALTGLAIKYGLLQSIKKLRDNHPKIEKGRISIRKLLSKTKSAKTAEVTKVDEKEFDNLCKKYGVAYNAVEDKGKNKVDVFYREEDSERMELVLKNMENDLKKEIKENEEILTDTYHIDHISPDGTIAESLAYKDKAEFEKNYKDMAWNGVPFESQHITKAEIEHVQNNFESIILQISGERNMDKILNNSIDGLYDLTEIKSKATEKISIKEKIKTKEVKQNKPQVKKDITKPKLVEGIGGR